MDPVKILVPQKKMPHEYLQQLDDDLLAILSNNKYPDDVKQSMFKQALSNYNIIRDRIEQPLELHVQNLPQTKMAKKDNNLLSTIPKTIRPLASELYNKIISTDGVLINDKQELEINGELIKGSNIIDLLHDFSRKRKVRPAKGYQELASVLSNQNIAREYIGNPDRWNLISGDPEEPSIVTTDNEVYTDEPPSSFVRQHSVETIPIWNRY